MQERAIQTNTPSTHNKVEKLYNTLVSTKKITSEQLGDKDTFVNGIDSPEKADKLFDTLISQGYFTAEDIGDRDRFKNSMWSEQAPKQEKESEPLYQIQSPIKGLEGEIRDSLPKLNLPKIPSIPGQTEAEYKAVEKTAQGDAVDKYLLDKQERDWNIEAQKHMPPTLEDVDTRIKSLEEEHRELIAGQKERPSANMYGGDGMSVGYLTTGRSKAAREQQEADRVKYKEVMSQIYDLQHQKDIIQKTEQLTSISPEDGGFKQLVSGLFKTGSIKDIATMGIRELVNSVNITQLYDKGTKEALSPLEKKTLLAYETLQFAQNEVASNPDLDMFSVGMGIQHSLRFMAEVAMTGGIGGIGKAALTGGAKALAKGAATMAGKTAYKTTLMPSTYAAGAQEMSNAYEYNPSAGATEKVMDRSVLDAAYRGFALNYAERLAEGVGTVVSDIGVFTKLAKTGFGKKLLGGSLETVTKLTDNKVYKTVDKALRYVGAQNMANIPMEMMEEMIVPVLSSGLLWQNDFEQLSDPRFYKMVALQSLIMGGATGGIQFAAGRTGARIEKNKTDKEYNSARMLLGSTLAETEELDALKLSLIDTAESNLFFNEDGSIIDSPFSNVLSQIDESDASIEFKEYANQYAESALKKYGQYEAIEAMAIDDIGEYTLKPSNGTRIAIATDSMGNTYYVLDKEDDLLVVRDVTTGEKKSIKEKDIVDSKEVSKDSFLTDYYMAKGGKIVSSSDEVAIEASKIEESLSTPIPLAAGHNVMYGDDIVEIVNIDESGTLYVRDEDGDFHTLNSADVMPIQQMEDVPIENMPPLTESEQTEINEAAPVEEGPSTEAVEEIDPLPYRKDKKGVDIVNEKGERSIDYTALLDNNPALFAEKWEEKKGPEGAKMYLDNTVIRHQEKINKLGVKLEKENNPNKIEDLENEIEALSIKRDAISDAINQRYGVESETETTASEETNLSKRESDINTLLDTVRRYNQMTTSGKKKEELGLLQRANALGFITIKDGFGNMSLKEIGTGRILSKKFADKRTGEQLKAHKTLGQYDQNVQEVFGLAASYPEVILNSLSWNKGRDLFIKGIEDVLANKQSASANDVLDFIEGIAISDNLTFGDNMTPETDVSIKDAFSGFVNHETESESLDTIEESESLEGVDIEDYLPNEVPVQAFDSIVEEDMPEWLASGYDNETEFREKDVTLTNEIEENNVRENTTSESQEATKDNAQSEGIEVSEEGTTNTHGGDEQGGDGVVPITNAEDRRQKQEVKEAYTPSSFEEVEDVAKVEISKEEAKVNTKPSEAQKEAGNYQKGHIKLNGFNITIEQPKGSTRSGVDKDGGEWSTTMNNTYGYFLGTKGKDGDHIDVFVGELLDSDRVFVIDQIKKPTYSEVPYEYKEKYWDINEGRKDERASIVKEDDKVKKPIILELWSKNLKDYPGNTRYVNGEDVAMVRAEGEYINDPRWKAHRSRLDSLKLLSDKEIESLSIRDYSADGGGKFDEHKVMMGFSSIEEAKEAYLSNYEEGWQGLGNITAVTLDNFKGWVASSKRKLKPFAEYKNIQEVSGSYGSLNTAFTTKEYKESLKKLRGKLSNLNSGMDPETLLLGLRVAGYHIEAGAHSFDEYARKMIEDLGENIKPFLRSFYNGIRDYPNVNFAKDMDSYEKVSNFDINNIDFNQHDHVTTTTNNPERHSDVANDENTGDEGLVSDITRRNSGEGGGDNPGVGKEGRNRVGGNQQEHNSTESTGDPTPTDREGSDTGVHQQEQSDGSSTGPARNTEHRGNDDVNQEGKADVGQGPRDGNSPVGEYSVNGVALGNLGDIQSSLPQLYPEQQNDVLFAERRFFTGSNIGKGVLFTNGTGTGKTFTGLGVIKRFVNMGKGNILILAPTDTKVGDWITDAKRLDLEVSQLRNTSDGGVGISATTYANFRDNTALLKRDFDLLVYDESHYLGQGQKGTADAAFEAHKICAQLPSRVRHQAEQDMIGLSPKHPADKFDTHEEYRRSPKYSELSAKYDQEREVWKGKVEAEVIRRVGRVKCLMLSASPFAYHSSLRYADGTLFEAEETIKKQEYNGTYNSASGFSSFMLSNFGYRMKYNKLTRPESGVDIDLMERMFYEKMHKEGVVSGRKLEVDADYSRSFTTVNSELGEQIDNGMQLFYDHSENGFKDKYPLLSDLAPRKKWNYLYINQLLECIKATQSIGRIKEHLELGRKVVLFHSYKSFVPSHPFHFSVGELLKAGKDKDESESAFQKKRDQAEQEIISFQQEYSHLWNLDLGELRNSLELLRSSFADRAREFNGDVSNKTKKENIKLFNKGNSGVDVLIVQRQAGKEGISLHDTHGTEQRVLIDLGLPIAPTDAIQTEGRIYRLGTKSNAIIEYLCIKTNFETNAYASKIAERVRTPENLAMGNKARDLETAFREGYINSSNVSPSEMLGAGGKESDTKIEVATDFDRAISFYYGQQKKTSRNKSSEGNDYFATPEPIGYKMVQWLGLQPNESALEPSAGHGAIARWFDDSTSNKFIEPIYKLSTEVRINSKGEVIQTTFEDFNLVNKFDGIAMNPPFGSHGKLAMEHVEKAFKHLKENGRIVAIVPMGSSMQKRLDNFLYGEDKKGKIINGNAELVMEIELPYATFERAGTTIGTKVIIIDKISGDSNRSYASKVDLTQKKTVKELFEAVRELDVPPRKKVLPVENLDVDTDVDIETDVNTNNSGVFKPIEEYKHTKTGEDMFLVRPEEFLGDRFYDIKREASANKGIYSRFVKGFLFKTREDAERFTSKVGREDDGIRYRDGVQSEINNTFNEKLQEQIDGTLPRGYIYSLGYPSSILQSAGIPNLPIELSPETLAKKAGKGYVSNHPFELSTIKNLPASIADPIAIFKSTKKDESRVILIEQSYNDSNFVAIIRVHKDKYVNNIPIEVNSVRSLYPKAHTQGIIDWIRSKDNLLQYVNKEKALKFISTQSTNLIADPNNSKDSRKIPKKLTQQQSYSAEVESSIKNLNSAANIVKNFKNPTPLEGEISSIAENLSTDLGVEINIVRSTEDIKHDNKRTERRMKDGKGWYDPKTGVVTIVAPNIASVDDAVATILHEAVGHKGLRDMFGDKFDTFLSDVYKNAGQDIQDRIQAKYIMGKHSSVEVATEEYLAEMAEQGFDDMTFFQRVKALFKEMLSKLGVSVELKDGDLRYVLWRSYRRLKKNPSMMDVISHTAADLRMKNELRFKDGELPLSNDISLSKAEIGVEALIDRMVSVKKLYGIIKERGGTIKEVADPYLQENLSLSRSTAAWDKVNDDVIEPMITKLAQVEKKSGKTYEDLNHYFMALHAPERNRKIVSDNVMKHLDKKLFRLSKEHSKVGVKYVKEIRNLISGRYGVVVMGNEVTVPDPSTLTAEEREIYAKALEMIDTNLAQVASDPGSENFSGFSNEEAAQVIEDFKDVEGLDEISSYIKKLSNFTIDTWQQYSMISTEQADGYRNMYEHYVPLRGWEETEDVDYSKILGSGYVNNDILNLNKSAKGRQSKADDIFANLASMAQSAIIAGNKNLIRLHTFRMVVANKDLIPDIALIKKTWLVDKSDPLTDSEEIWVEVYEKPSQELFDAGRAKFGSNDTSYEPHKTKSQTALHQVPVIVNGTRQVLEFKGVIGLSVSSAINGTNVKDLTKTTGAVGSVTRWISANMTSKNPDFMMINFMRDATFGVASYGIEGGSKTDLMINISKSFKAVHDNINRKNQDSEIQKYYEEFKEHGGRTGFIHLKNVDDLKKDLDRIRRKTKGEKNIEDRLLRNTAMTVGKDVLTYMATMSEDTVRFAVFLTERQKGTSAREAASRAKEISVNFNRKGTVTTNINALYAFFNASVQGTNKLYQLAKNHPKAFTKTVATLMAFSFANAFISALCSGEDELGNKEYDNLSDYVKMTNFVILNPFSDGKEFITIPSPHGLRIFTALGALLADVVRGKKKVDDAALLFLKQMAGDLIPLDIDALNLTSDNPIRDILVGASPTALRPFAEVVVNRDFMGNPIYKEPFLSSSEGKIPKWKQAFKSTSPILVGMARELNNLGGGTDNRSSAIQFDRDIRDVDRANYGYLFDVNPAKIEHIAQGFFGGRLRFWNDAFKTGHSLITGEEVNKGNIPVVRRLYQEPRGLSAWRKYYQVRDRVGDINAVISSLKKERDKEGLRTLYSNPLVPRLVKTYSRYDKKLRELYGKKKDATEEDIVEIDARIDSLVLDLAKKVKEIDMEYGNPELKINQ